MAFPSTPILDDFNRADGALGANWGDGGFDGAGNTPTVWTNTAVTTTSVSGTAAWQTTFGADVECYMSIPAAATSVVQATPYVKAKNIGTGTACWYVVDFRSDLSSADTYRVYNNTYSALLLHLTPTFGAGHKTGMKAYTSGGDIIIESWLNTGSGWTLIGSYTDTGAVATYPLLASSGGKIAFSMYGGGNSVTRAIDDFGGGTVVTSVASLSSLDLTKHPRMNMRH